MCDSEHAWRVFGRECASVCLVCLSFCLSISIWCSFQIRSFLLFARLRCVRASKRHRDRVCKCHVHNFVEFDDLYFFVFQYSIFSCGRGKPPLHHARNTDVVIQLHAHYVFFFHGNCALRAEGSFTDPAHAKHNGQYPSLQVLLYF